MTKASPSFKNPTNQHTHSYFIRKTLRIAANARRRGNHPFGALLVLRNRIILRAENTVGTSRDATQHAELRLVSRACRKFDPGTLREAILYTSTEPCAMCAGAIYWAGIRTVVFGLRAERLGQLAGGSLVVPSRIIYQRGKEKTFVHGPVDSRLAEEVHAGFWRRPEFDETSNSPA